jgi:hypothetical protein
VGCCVLIHTKPATWRSWDYHAKKGFYIGPALDLYRSFKLVKSNTKSQIISNTIKLCHVYRTILSPSAEDKIIHGLQVMSGTLKDVPPLMCISQVDAIANLQDLFESWHLLGPLSLSPTHILAQSRPWVGILELPRMAIPVMPQAVLTPMPAWVPPSKSSTIRPLRAELQPIHVTPR